MLRYMRHSHILLPKNLKVDRIPYHNVTSYIIPYEGEHIIVCESSGMSGTATPSQSKIERPTDIYTFCKIYSNGDITVEGLDVSISPIEDYYKTVQVGLDGIHCSEGDFVLKTAESSVLADEDKLVVTSSIEYEFKSIAEGFKKRNLPNANIISP